MIRHKRVSIDLQPTGPYLFRDAPTVLAAIRTLRNNAKLRLRPDEAPDQLLGVEAHPLAIIKQAPNQVAPQPMKP
jgi:hypothetical protein